MIAFLQLVFSIIACGLAIWIPYKIKWEQFYAGLFADYRGHDFAEAVQGIVYFFESTCNKDVPQIKYNYEEIFKKDFPEPNDKKSENEKSASSKLHYQRRLLVQFFLQLDQCANTVFISNRRIQRDFTKNEANIIKALYFMNEAVEESDIVFKDISSYDRIPNYKKIKRYKPKHGTYLRPAEKSAKIYSLKMEPPMPNENAFSALILKHARSHNLLVDDGTNYLYPCYDGVLDEKLYFSSQPKVLFVCKEPYDDFWDDGQPYGGNVAIYEKFSDYECVYKNYVAYRTIADVLYAVHHDVCYDEVQRAQKTEVARELLGAAIINVGKMPAQITSPISHMKKVYDIWKPILFEQIKYFSPDVLVFGYTMNLFRADLFAGCDAPACKMYGGDLLGSVVHEGKLLLDAFHPSARKNKAAYVDTIVAAVRDWKAGII